MLLNCVVTALLGRAVSLALVVRLARARDRCMVYGKIARVIYLKIWQYILGDTPLTQVAL